MNDQLENGVEQGMAMMDQLQRWMLLQGVDLLKNVLIFCLILLIGKIVIGWLCGLVRAALKREKRVSEMLENFAVNVCHKLLWVVVLIMALPRLGVEVAPLIAGLGVTGFILGFAFQDALGNLASGIMILLNEPFRIGDVVDVAGHTGIVKELNVMATGMVSFDNKRIVIPNKTVWGGSIVNYTALDTRRVDLAVGISYGADIGKARDVIMKVVKANDKVLEDPAPQVEMVEMADSSLNFAIRPWVRTDDYWTVFFALNRGIKEALDREGIEIPFPQMDIHHHGMPEQMQR